MKSFYSKFSKLFKTPLQPAKEATSNLIAEPETPIAQKYPEALVQALGGTDVIACIPEINEEIEFSGYYDPQDNPKSYKELELALDNMSISTETLIARGTDATGRNYFVMRCIFDHYYDNNYYSYLMGEVDDYTEVNMEEVCETGYLVIGERGPSEHWCIPANGLASYLAQLGRPSPETDLKIFETIAQIIKGDTIQFSKPYDIFKDKDGQPEYAEYTNICLQGYELKLSEDTKSRLTV